MTDLPPRMQAVRLHGFDPEGLRVEPTDIPQPVDDEVLVRVRAASVNPVDYKTAQGKFPMVAADDLPITLGRDAAGTIEAVGTRAHFMLSKGDRVIAHLGFDRGGQAELVVVKAVELVSLPKEVSFEQGAGVGLAAMTAWQGLFVHGNLQAGETVLILGAAGGVGHLAVQFAKVKGATVIATCGTDDLDFVTGLGADRVLDYHAQWVADEASGVDLVLDLVGGEAGEQALEAVRDGGRFVSTREAPAASSRAVTIPPRWYAEPNAAQLTELGQLVAGGQVTVTASETFPLAEVAKAYERQEHGHVRGKIVLTVDEDG